MKRNPSIEGSLELMLETAGLPKTLLFDSFGALRRYTDHKKMISLWEATAQASSELARRDDLLKMHEVQYPGTVGDILTIRDNDIRQRKEARALLDAANAAFIQEFMRVVGL